ncbi:hypothetical protein K435DRAFT_873349 [Dendrothele bispora CBS 962.96]|uniref:DUF6534 domain-containing protein n=1 Tax=Dendrothele bispora (strain CBS 962.96) TaxID=1314807 RepID=A0A4S8KZJ5_DENBC|nr:hypothetical protein K435DRAFT_874822 [Dendrothele bispora CBS 962.96]THU81420.1 hypothetical protein K435DRAFT_873349 [Dendrothele bispora CBS 962.96]
MSFSTTAEKIFGPLLIGVFFNAILFGVLAVQAHLYFNWNRSGERWTRYLIIVLLALETLNTGVDFAIIYEGLFKKLGQPSLDIPLLAANPVLISSISTLVQIYYAWRIRILTRSNVLAGFIFVLALISFASSICGTVFTALHPNWGDGFDQNLLRSLITWLTTSALCDVVIAIAMIFFLTTHKEDSMGVTKCVVNKIIILTIQTGVLTSVAAVADILTFTLIKESTIQFIWDFSISKLYTNSLLSMLNAREEWSKKLEARNDVESISNVSFAHVDGLADYSEEKSRQY